MLHQGSLDANCRLEDDFFYSLAFQEQYSISWITHPEGLVPNEAVVGYCITQSGLEWGLHHSVVNPLGGLVMESVAEPLLGNNELPLSGDPYGRPEEPAVFSFSWRNMDSKVD